MLLDFSSHDVDYGTRYSERRGKVIELIEEPDPVKAKAAGQDVQRLIKEKENQRRQARAKYEEFCNHGLEGSRRALAVTVTLKATRYREQLLFGCERVGC